MAGLFRYLEEILTNAAEKAAKKKAQLFAKTKRLQREVLLEGEERAKEAVGDGLERGGKTKDKPAQGTPSARRKSALKRLDIQKKERQDHRAKVRVESARGQAAVQKARTIKERIKIKREKSRDLWCARGA